MSKLAKITLFTIAVLGTFANAYTMTPDGGYVSGNTYTMTPDGSYVGGSNYEMTPDGSYVGTN